MDSIKVFAPNTVANVGCGYDVLGFALEGYGDELTVSKRSDSDLVITKIEGADLPMDSETNVATVAIKAMLSQLGSNQGFDLTIKKSINPGSGLGSSASSSAGAVFAANELLGKPFTKHELVAFAMEGERSSSGSAHADNVAPSLLGGFTVVRSYDPLDVFNVPFPSELLAVIIYPEVQVKTADAKRVLKKQVDLKDAVRQWGNMAGMISGLMSGNFERIGVSMEDVIVEPVRGMLIPFYDEAKRVALECGALGFNISGSGPSSFALTNNPDTAEKIRRACAAVYDEGGISTISFVSRINQEGTKVI
ncbi:MAG: homoserine kinase [Cyclobacteriaceae bacterium]